LQKQMLFCFSLAIVVYLCYNYIQDDFDRKEKTYGN
jgi:hypothetical protein